MLVIRRPILVEGRYDKIKLSSLVKANIITTDGFGIFSAAEKASLIRRLAMAHGLIVLTDSDGAGLVIRNYIKNLVPKDKLIHLYIPQVKGRERRKTEASKEGYLGVEGMDADCLRALLAPYADDAEVRLPLSLTKADFYSLGLSGRENSASLRKALTEALALPSNLSADALLAAINMLITEDDFNAALQAAKSKLKSEDFPFVKHE